MHVIPAFQPAVRYGGPVYSVAGLCHGLQANGIEVRVLTTDSAGPDERLDVETGRETEWQEIPVRYCRRDYPESVSFALLRALPEALRWADVVHLTGVYNFPTFPTLALCQIMDKPLVWSPRGALQRWGGSRRVMAKRVWNRLAILAGGGRAVFHATAEAERLESGPAFASCQWRIVPNGVTVLPARPRIADREAFRILSIGRLDPKKGIEILLDAFRLLRDRHPAADIRLAIAGAGEPSYVSHLRSYSAGLGLDGVAKFHGFVDGTRKSDLFAESDVAVFPSHTENFGMVVAEALAHSVPVIVSPNMPWQDVESRGCGLCVNNDPSTVASALERIMTMDLPAMGAAGRSWMERDFSWAGRARAMAVVYQELLSGARR